MTERRGTPRADDGIRTRDPNLGKVVLYQLSHVRMSVRTGGPCDVGNPSRTGAVRSGLGLRPQEQGELGVDVDVVGLSAGRHSGVGAAEELGALAQRHLEQRPAGR